MFRGISRVQYLDLAHNRLVALDLGLVSTRALRHLDLAHNLLARVQVGDRPFPRLTSLNMSHNAVTKYTVDPNIRLTFKSLEYLDLSFNRISGTILSHEIDIFKRNLVVDLSSNLITRVDMRRTARDLVNARHSYYALPYTTTYRLHHNPVQIFLTIFKYFLPTHKYRIFPAALRLFRRDPELYIQLELCPGVAVRAVPVPAASRGRAHGGLQPVHLPRAGLLRHGSLPTVS